MNVRNAIDWVWDNNARKWIWKKNQSMEKTRSVCVLQIALHSWEYFQTNNTGTCLKIYLRFSSRHAGSFKFLNIPRRIGAKTGSIGPSTPLFYKEILVWSLYKSCIFVLRSPPEHRLAHPTLVFKWAVLANLILRSLFSERIAKVTIDHSIPYCRNHRRNDYI